MTGHDLDLVYFRDEVHEAENAVSSGKRDWAVNYAADVNILAAEVEFLRAKLAAAEQERDAYKRAKAENDERFMLRYQRAEAALAAVREAVEPLAGFALDEFARSYARRDEDATVVVQALYDLRHALAAAEQDEPSEVCAKPMHKNCECVRPKGHAGYCNCTYRNAPEQS